MDDLAHNIIVLKGSVELRIEGQPALIIPTGSVFDFEWAKRHEVLAHESDTMVLHLMLNGMPLNYDLLPPGEKQGYLRYQGLH